MNWKVYDKVYYNYSHFQWIMGLIWLFMKDYEIDVVYMFSIEKLMMFMKRYDMWKANSHIMMIDPLWLMMLRVIPMIMTLCG